MIFKIAIIVIVCIILVLLILVAGKINITIKFKRDARKLFSGSPGITHSLYQPEQINDLPIPVQRYFKHVLNAGQQYISFVRIIHDGLFKPGLTKPWVKIKGEQYATTAKPGFIWKGSTNAFTARDMYIENKGRLVVSLFSVYTIVDERGETYNQGELLRWLGESILYPTNLLPSDRLRWLTIDDNNATLEFSYNGLLLKFMVSFNAAGEIIQMETKRYMDKNSLNTWIIRPGNYQQINNIIVPLYFDVMWRIKNEDFSYARFTIRKIEYNNPTLF